MNNNLRKKMFDKLNYFMAISSIATCVFYAIYYSMTDDNIMAILSALTIILPILIYVVDWLLKNRIPDTIKLAYLLFIFISAVLGGIVDLYNTVYLYDKMIHFVSGLFVTWISAVLYINYFKHKEDLKLFIIYLISTNIAIATLWEIGEYTFGLVTGKIVQKGLDDTMLDIISAVIGGIIILVIYIMKMKDKKQESK